MAYDKGKGKRMHVPVTFIYVLSTREGWNLSEICAHSCQLEVGPSLPP